MGALDIGRVLAQKFLHLFRLAIHDCNGNPCQTIRGCSNVGKVSGPKKFFPLCLTDQVTLGNRSTKPGR